jgi:DNA-binding transcriptional ArsR family regulator
MSTDELQAHAREASQLLKAMSNNHRLLILCQLLDEECSVGELVRRIGLSQSALSQHLARLRRDSLVRTRRDAQTIYYTLSSPEIRAIIGTLHQIYCERPSSGLDATGRPELSARAAAAG